MYRLPHNSRDNLTNFLSEFSATLIEYNTRGHNQGACPGGGGAQGAWAPPHEIEKAKKKVVRANLNLFYLYILLVC